MDTRSKSTDPEKEKSIDITGDAKNLIIETKKYLFRDSGYIIFCLMNKIPVMKVMTNTTQQLPFEKFF